MTTEIQTHSWCDDSKPVQTGIFSGCLRHEHFKCVGVSSQPLSCRFFACVIAIRNPRSSENEHGKHHIH